MTYWLVEVGKLECDECGKREKAEFDREQNPVLEESIWFRDLQEKGWIYDKSKDRHLCPKCSKSVSSPSC